MEPTAQLVTLEPATTAVVHTTIPFAEMPAFFDRAYGEVIGALGSQGVEITGPAFALYPRMPGETAELEAGFPTSSPVTPTGEVIASSLPGGQAGQVLYVGPYDGLPEAYAALHAWMLTQGVQPGEVVWETYVTEPSPDGDPNANETLITWPVTSTPVSTTSQ